MLNSFFSAESYAENEIMNPVESPESCSGLKQEVYGPFFLWMYACHAYPPRSWTLTLLPYYFCTLHGMWQRRCQNCWYPRSSMAVGIRKPFKRGWLVTTSSMLIRRHLTDKNDHFLKEGNEVENGGRGLTDSWEMNEGIFAQGSKDFFKGIVFRGWSTEN